MPVTKWMHKYVCGVNNPVIMNPTLLRNDSSLEVSHICRNNVVFFGEVQQESLCLCFAQKDKTCFMRGLAGLVH